MHIDLAWKFYALIRVVHLSGLHCSTYVKLRQNVYSWRDYLAFQYLKQNLCTNPLVEWCSSSWEVLHLFETWSCFLPQRAPPAHLGIRTCELQYFSYGLNKETTLWKGGSGNVTNRCNPYQLESFRGSWHTWGISHRWRLPIAIHHNSSATGDTGSGTALI